MDKKYISIIFLICTTSAFIFPQFSCKKDKNAVKIQGQITDPNSNIVVEGAKVIFSASKVTNGIYNAGYEEVSRTLSDADGNFYFEMQEEHVAGYKLLISKSGYFSTETDIPVNDIVIGEPYISNILFYPIGYIKLKVMNIAPFDSTDIISYSFTSGYMNCYEGCSNSLNFGYGTDVKDSLKCKTYGNQNIIVTWSVTKNHFSTQHNATVYCNAFDTVSYQILY